jgi:soluble lytic murein transglycosylase-like protein
MRIVFLTLSLLIITSMIASIYSTNIEEKLNEPMFKNNRGEIDIPSSIIMYESIEKYSDIYDIPKHIAYNVAYMETKYKGPFHWKYNHTLESYAGAIGPMQIMPSTANLVKKQKVSKFDLMNDIELNVEISMCLLSILYKKYNDWSIVCGAYNTGKPVVNDYANYCNSNKNYKSKWMKIE